MTKSDEPAFPESITFTGSLGLTKREWFAGLAMIGMYANSLWNQTVQDNAKLAVECADALIAELAKEKP